MYEMMNEVYKILLPIHESYHDYEKLAVVHETLQHAFRNIISNVSFHSGLTFLGCLLLYLFTVGLIPPPFSHLLPSITVLILQLFYIFYNRGVIKWFPFSLS